MKRRGAALLMATIISCTEVMGTGMPVFADDYAESPAQTETAEELTEENDEDAWLDADAADSQEDVTDADLEDDSVLDDFDSDEFWEELIIDDDSETVTVDEEELTDIGDVSETDEEGTTAEEDLTDEDAEEELLAEDLDEALEDAEEPELLEEEDSLFLAADDAYYQYDLALQDYWSSNMLIGDSRWIGRYDAGSCWVVDEISPEGDKIWLETRSVEIIRSQRYEEDVQDWVDTDETIVNISEDENGWSLYGENYGRVILKVVFDPPRDGMDPVVQDDLEVYVNGDVWYSEIWSGAHTSQLMMLPGDTKEIYTSLGRDWRYSDEDWGSEPYFAYRVEIEGNEDGPFYDTNLIAAEVEDDGKTLSITASEDVGNTWVGVKFILLDENGADAGEVASAGMEIYVSDDYYAIEPAELLDWEGNNVNPWLGEELNLNDFDLKLYHYAAGDEAQLQEDAVLYLTYWDENCWDVKAGTENDPIPVLVRKNTWSTNLEITARMPDDDVDDYNSYHARTWYDIGSLDFGSGIWLEPSYGEPWDMRLFTGDPLEVRIAGLDDLDYDIDWNVKQVSGDDWFEPECADYKISEGGRCITFRTAGGSTEGTICAGFTISYRGYELIWEDMWINLQETGWEYNRVRDWDGGNEMLINDSIWIGRYDTNGRMWNRDCPDGDDFPAVVEKVEILASQRWNDENEEWENVDDTIVQIDARDDGWDLRGENYGRVLVQVNYAPDPGWDNPYGITTWTQDDLEIYVNGDIWNANWWGDDNTDRMLTNSYKEFYTSLSRSWRYSDRDQGYEDEVPYRIELAGDENGPWYDTNLISAEVAEDGTTLRVESFGENGDTNIGVRFILLDEEGSDIGEVTYRNIHVDVSEGYFQILPTVLQYAEGEPINPGLGEELDLGSIGLELYWYENGQEPQVQEDAAFFLKGWDENCWDVKEGTENDAIPVLIRKGDWGTNLYVEARRFREDWEDLDETEEDDRYEFLSSYDFWCDGLDNGGTWLETSYSDRWNARLFTDEPLKLTFKTGAFEDLDYDVEWEVQQFNDDGPYPAGCVTWEVTDAGRSIILSAVAGHEEEDFNVHAYARYKDNEFGQEDIWIHIQESGWEYREVRDWEGAREMLINDNIWIGKYDPGLHIWNKDHPDGDEFGAIVKNVEITGVQRWNDEIEDWEDVDETVVILDQNEDGWNLHGEDYGRVLVRVTYAPKPEDGLTGIGEWTPENDMEIYVNGDIWDANWWADNNSENMLPGSYKEFYTSLGHQWRYGDDNQGYEGDLAYRIELDGDEDGPYYDTNLILAEVAEDGRTLQVTAFEGDNYWDTDIAVRYILLKEDGSDDYEVAYRHFHVRVTDGYHEIEPAWLNDASGEAINPQLGEELNLNDVPFELYWYELGKEPVLQEKERVEFRLEGWDDNCWDVKEGTENDPIPVLIRKGDWGTDFRIEAFQLRDDWEDWDEANRYEHRTTQWYNVGNLDYHSWLESSYGDPWDAKLFTDTPLTLTFHLDEYPDLDYDIEWEADRYDDDGNPHDVDGVNVTYSGDRKSIILSVDDGYDIEQNDNHFDIHVRAMYRGNEIARQDTGVNILAAEYNYEFPIDNGIIALPGAQIMIENWMFCQVLDAEHPDWEAIPVAITDVSIEVIPGEGEADYVTLEPWDDGNGWTLHANSFGNGNGVIKYKAYGSAEDEEPQEHEFFFNVQGVIWMTDLYSSNNTDQILPGETLDLIGDIAEIYYNEEAQDDNDRYLPGDTPYKVEWTGMGDNWENTITLEPYEENQNVVRVTANPEAEDDWWAGVQYTVFEADENGDYKLDGEGNRIELQRSREMWLRVSDMYYTIAADYFHLSNGDSVTPDTIRARVLLFDRDHPEGEEVEADIRFELPPSADERLALSEDQKTLTIAETENAKLPQGNTEETGISLIGDFVNKFGDNDSHDIWYRFGLCSHELTKTEAKAATCEEDGNTEYYSCSICGQIFSDGEGKTRIHQEDTVIEALGHEWGEAAYTWSADNKKVTAARTCKHDVGHIQTETVDTVSEVAVKATCDTKGSTKYTSKAFTNEAFAVQTKTVEDIAALGHTWGSAVYTWSADNSKVTATRTCTRDAGHVETETAAVTSKVSQAATCKAKGKTTYTASFKNTAFAAQTKTLEDIPLAAHTAGEWKVTKEATCTETGVETQYCSVCGQAIGTRTVAAKGHTLVKTAKKAATVTAEGNIEYYTCSVCGKIYSDAKGTKEIKLADTVIAKLPNPEGDVSDKTSVAAVDQEISKMSDTAEPKGSSFAKIQVKSTKQTKNSITVSWNKVKGATGYIIYGNKCGKGVPFMRLSKQKKNSFVYKKLTKGTYYKFSVVAYKTVNGKDTIIATGKTIHVATKGGKVTNISKLKLNVKKKTLKPKKTLKLKVTKVKQSSKLKLVEHRKIKYESSNTKVATVSKTGVIKAKKAGTCTIYVYAHNGVYATVKITVKK